MDRRPRLCIIVLACVLWSTSAASCDVANRDVPVPWRYAISEVEQTDREGAERASLRASAESWVVDAKDPGQNLPPVGRSLFDYIIARSDGLSVSSDVPFPFSTLVQLIAGRLDPENGISHTKRVLMPLNRSLQRHAPKPEFFKYPRAVLAIDTEPTFSPDSAGILLKDRLYVGYQEKANAVEVISYNEAAGRFEFQVVKDYRAEGARQVFYANRTLCTSCHQNHGPIFARQLWDETNANSTVAALLKAERRNFYDFPIHQGVDVPNAIDAATDRANKLSAFQLLWREGCKSLYHVESVDCRAAAFRLTLQHLLSGARGFDTSVAQYQGLVSSLSKQWLKKWPNGLLIPDADIPNRNPVLHTAQLRNYAAMDGGQVRSTAEPPNQSDIRSIFEPSNPRPPLEVWRLTTTGVTQANRLISGLGAFLSANDIRRVDDHLFGKGTKEWVYGSDCELTPRADAGVIDRLTFRCESAQKVSAGRLSISGVVYFQHGKPVKGSIDRVIFDAGEELGDLDIVSGKLEANADDLVATLHMRQKYSGLHARRENGNAIRSLSLSWKSSAQKNAAVFSGKVKATVVDDFTPVAQAIEKMVDETLSGHSDVFTGKPFRRAAIMKALFEQLNMPDLKWCCADVHRLPEPQLAPGLMPEEPTFMKQKDHILRSFGKYCAKCHFGLETFPPNFLYGEPERVKYNLNRCAERIFFRLEMWRLGPDLRPEPPMPPVSTLRRLNIDPEQWPHQDDLRTLRDYVADVLRSQTGRVPKLEDLKMRGYDNLRECPPVLREPERN
jgi:hypothetical protein